jgi:peptidoglycan/xylan/chitin deacetylase (PgdA/CDA1 family)
MAVLCLMYHHTPAGPPQTSWDVPLNDLRTTIDWMIEAGVSFIDLEQTRNPGKLTQGMHVAITFDDGHRTNAAAFEFLASRSIRPAAFIVKEWSRERPQYLPASMIADLADICDFGAHGATHTGLTYLDDQALEAELNGSRSYLEDTLGRPVDTMALPGGMGDRRVFEAASKAGYRLIGTSVEDINTRPGLRLNRVQWRGRAHDLRNGAGRLLAQKAVVASCHPPFDGCSGGSGPYASGWLREGDNLRREKVRLTVVRQERLHLRGARSVELNQAASSRG